MNNKNENTNIKNKVVNIIGAGLAGCECAYILAKNGVKVRLYEMKPNYHSDAHKSDNFAELVCSNSLKSEAITNACGLLKKEMEILDSLFVRSAYFSRVPAGQALAVDREKFSSFVTSEIESNLNIEIIHKKIDKIDDVCDMSSLSDITVIATGPLTGTELFEDIKRIVGDDSMYFYDAASPIIDADSINMDIAYTMDRYGTIGEGDYLNLPMNKEQYFSFYNELINAREANRHGFDKVVLFEGCMPIEYMAKRAEKTLLFGPLKPVGLDKNGEKNYAVVQLRAENREKTMYNMVGFQTSLAYPEQKRIFSMIPGLEKAEFVRYGVMHKNSYINGGKVLDDNFCMRKNSNIYFAGQISGVEGYVESAASGLIVAYSILAENKGKKITFPSTTMLGSLAKYVSTENEDFQPMNANFGIIKPLDERIKDKKEKYQRLADRAISDMYKFKESLGDICE